MIFVTLSTHYIYISSFISEIIQIKLSYNNHRLMYELPIYISDLPDSCSLFSITNMYFVISIQMGQPEGFDCELCSQFFYLLLTVLPL